MKCPKCGYMSFDSNETCPKCQRNIISERERMNHLPFMPEPPFLLGTLLSKTGDSQISVELNEAPFPAETPEVLPSLEQETGPAFPEMGLEKISLQEDAAAAGESPETLAIEEEPLPIEDLDFEEEPSAEEDLVEVSMGTDEPGEFMGSESSPLDEEALSLELEDLLEADKRSEAVEEKEPDAEAMTIKMEAFEPVAVETPAGLFTSREVEEPEDLFDSPAPDETGLIEEEISAEEVLFPEPPAPEQKPSPGDPDELFSPDDLKGYKIGQYDILTQPSPLKDHTQAAAPSAPGAKPPETKEVWDEISRDLEDLDFDIDEA